MALALISRTINVVLLVFRSLVAEEIASLENENVRLCWNIDPPDRAHVVNIKHPSNKVIFFIVDNEVISSNISEYIGKWKFYGNPTSGKVDFVFMNITKSDAGDYSTQIGGHSERYGVTLVVYLKPEKPIITVLKEPVVNSSMVVSCYSQSKSVPTGHRSLTMTYVWYITASKIVDGGRYHSNGNQLIIPNITEKYEGWEIMCAAEETTKLPSDNSSAYRITVEYGPGPVTVSPFKVSYTLLEFTDTLGPIQCNSDCNPECMYQWIRDGTSVTNGAVLLVNNITRKQTGTYHCIATNKHNTRGQVSSTISVLVEYAPRNTTLVTSAGQNVNETTTVTFQCTTESVPGSTLQLVYQEEETVSITSEKDTVNSTFRILRANCLDTGKYFCSATNKVGSSDSDKINLNVFCSPRHDDRGNVINRYIVGTGDDMDITGTFIANPEPNISWHFQSLMSNDNTELQNNTDSFQFFVDFNHVTYTSRALRTNMKAEYFGQYVLIVLNDFGKEEFTIYIEQTSQPEINYIIVGATGGIPIVLIIVIMVIVHVLKKRRISGKGADNEEEDVCDKSAEMEYRYQKAKPRVDINAKELPSEKTAKGAVYTDGGIVEGVSMLSSENVYANSETQKRPFDKSFRKKNKDGLVYVDIEISGVERDQEGVILHGRDNRNDYADIDLALTLQKT